MKKTSQITLLCLIAFSMLASSEAQARLANRVFIVFDEVGFAMLNVTYILGGSTDNEKKKANIIFMPISFGFGGVVNYGVAPTVYRWSDQQIIGARQIVVIGKSVDGKKIKVELNTDTAPLRVLMFEPNDGRQVLVRTLQDSKMKLQKTRANQDEEPINYTDSYTDSEVEVEEDDLDIGDVDTSTDSGTSMDYEGYYY